jgi:hypothetical protein
MRLPRLAGVAGAMLLAGSAVASAGGAASTPPAAADFHTQNFDRSTTVDNKWFPLKPGTQLIFTGTTIEGKKLVPHRIVFTVTDLAKTVGGVRSIVVWDRDYTDGQLVEQELSFFAQDNDGNVWHTGEYPEVWENGKIVEAPAWLADVKGAYAGLEMHAAPRLSYPAYEQGYAPPPISWTDRGQVYKVGQKMCVPAGCHSNVLTIREYNPDEPGRSQLKYYAPGLGNIGVGFLGNEPGKEKLALAKLVQLAASGLASARTNALKMEKRAYTIRKSVYGTTAPAQRLKGP